jgi:hypothetical protein
MRCPPSRSAASIPWSKWTIGCGPATGLKEKDKAALVLSLGAYLGCMLVRELGGSWVPRSVIHQSAVVVGSRAFLPFLRLQHYTRDTQSALDCSLSQFFLEARRHHGAERG